MEGEDFSLKKFWIEQTVQWNTVQHFKLTNQSAHTKWEIQEINILALPMEVFYNVQDKLDQRMLLMWWSNQPGLLQESWKVKNLFFL